MRLVCDIETNGLLLDVTTCHCAVTYNIDTKVYTYYRPGDMTRLVNDLEDASLIIGHNWLGYDEAVLKKLYNYQPFAKVIDTYLLSKLGCYDLVDTDLGLIKVGKLPSKLHGSHSLKAWGYRVGDNKGEFAETTDWSEYSDDMLEYCKQDVAVTYKVYEKLRTKDVPESALDIEQKVQRIITQQHINGWRFDYEKAQELHVELVQEVSELENEISKNFTPLFLPDGKIRTYKKPFKRNGISYLGDNQPIALTDFNPGSRSHIVTWFGKWYGWEPTKFTEKGNPIVDADVLRELDYPEAELLVKYFDANKLLGMLAEGDKAWIKLLRKDKDNEYRIHGSADILGAVTGRFTHSNPNLAQVPSVRAYKGKEVRSLFSVPDGYKLVGCDASGLELRTLSHYLALYDGGKYGETVVSGDIHTANQQAAGLPTRDNAKTFIYGFLYGAGAEKIGQIVGGTAREGQVLKDTFLKKVPGLQDLITAVQRKANQGYLTGVSGRKLYVRSQHSALNVLLQSAGAYVMKYYLVIIEEKLRLGGYVFKFLGNIHDEVQIQVKEEQAEEVAKICEASFADVTQQLNFRCKLEGEAKIGDDWYGTH